MKRYKDKICEWCGEVFTPRSSTSRFCNKQHFDTCIICGKEYEVPRNRLTEKDKSRTCSKECAAILRKQTCRLKYGGNAPASSKFIQKKMQATMLDKYGVKFATQSNRFKEKTKQTNLSKYGAEHHMKTEQGKRTVTERYYKKTGYYYPQQNPEVQVKTKQHILDKYGVTNIMQNQQIRNKQAQHNKISTLENKVINILNNYSIEFIHHYNLTKDKYSHEFDFYIPKYNLLIDCDGIYYHSYLSDPNGKQVLDYYDDDRLYIVQDNYLFHVIVEGNEESDIKHLLHILDQKDGIIKYDSKLFNWCRNIGFPYPNYSKDRLLGDYISLQKYQNEKYNSKSRLGDSIIKYYHKSLYDVRVQKPFSIREAWEDNLLLKKVIANRLIYINDVDPSKILRGFNISKICPQASIFNPVLAKYISNKYLSEYKSVFDPFSGFSGRLLGVCSTNKYYIGQDRNIKAVEESNEIIKEYKLKAEVSYKDIFKDGSNEYDCLLTCPPYNDKEIYSDETIFKTCDEWIELCLNKYKCKKYVFVVDSTEKFKNNIAEEVKSSSHFSNNTEYIIVI